MSGAASPSHGPSRPAPPFGCWCGEGELRREFKTHRFGLVRCVACGCYRIDPPPVTQDQESAEFYTQYYSTSEDARNLVPEDPAATRNSRFWKVVDRFPELAIPRGRVADIGCGEGGLCAELKAAGWPWVVGFDLSRSRIERARRLHPGIGFQARPFPGEGIAEASLDLVVMDNVIEHLTDPASTLRTVARHLARGGRVAVITPNMRSGQFRLLGRRWTPELSPHAHIFLFTPDSLRRLLSMCGLEVETTGSYQMEPYPIGRMIAEFRRREFKEAAWHAMQEAGSFYARLIKSGPMVFAVAKRRERGDER
jgi:2-polyprenyl-3-methyl-5-hydroxy-6-metoxy-1,4-benzoquinol methylase